MNLMGILFLLVLVTSEARSQAAFFSFEDGFSTEPGSEVMLKNLPPAISQDSLGICYSHAAAQIFNYHNCQYRKIDCSKLPDSEKASALAMSRYTAADVPDDEAEYASSYRGIPEGGYAARTLAIASLVVGQVPTEECASLDRLLGKLGGAENIKTAQTAAFKKLQKIYEEAKAIDPTCSTCLSTFTSTAQTNIEKQFDLKTDNKKLLQAFLEESYEKFLDSLMIPKECSRMKNNVFFEGQNDMSIQVFPSGKQKTDYESTKNKIIEVLKNGNPLMLQNICGEEKVTKDCKNRHVVVVTGFRRVCTTSKKKCYDAIRVQNSWGQSWQDAYNGGWVEASNLINSTHYTEGHLAWLEKTKQK